MQLPILLFASYVLLGNSDYLVAQRRLAPPRIYNNSSEEIAAITAEQLQSDKGVWIDIDQSIAGLTGITGWQIFILNPISQEIIYAVRGDGSPSRRIWWTGRMDNGKYPQVGTQLNFRLVIRTAASTAASEIANFQIVNATRSFRNVDRGFRLTPSGGTGMLRASFTDDDDYPQRYTLYPLVYADLNFHYNRRHFLGGQLHSTNRLMVKQDAAYYAHLGFFYQYAVLSRAWGAPIDWKLGLEGFFTRFGVVIDQASHLPSQQPNGAINQRGWDIYSKGGAVSSRMTYFATRSLGLEIAGNYGKSILGNKGTVTSFEFGPNIALGEQLMVRISAQRKNLVADPNGIKDRLVERRAKLDFFKFFIDVQM